MCYSRAEIYTCHSIKEYEVRELCYSSSEDYTTKFQIKSNTFQSKSNVLHFVHLFLEFEIFRLF